MLHELKETLIAYCQPVMDFCSSLGETGLFILAFIESSFFPIPPDFLYIPMVLNGAHNPYWLALVASVGSVLGALFGYGIGFWGGRPIAIKVLDVFNFKKSSVSSDSLISKAEEFFERYGSIAVLIAAFTPVPYKVITIASGICRMPFFDFVLYSAIGRAGRFFTVVFLLVNFGEWILANFFMLSLAAALVALLAYLIWKNSKSN